MNNHYFKVITSIIINYFALKKQCRGYKQSIVVFFGEYSVREKHANIDCYCLYCKEKLSATKKYIKQIKLN